MKSAAVFKTDRGYLYPFADFRIAALFCHNSKKALYFCSLFKERKDAVSENRITKEEAVDLLKKKYESLLDGGENRFPKRSDFSEKEVVAIKAVLGPWPRALEAAGIKTPRDDDKAQRTKEKRIMKKRAENLARKSQK